MKTTHIKDLGLLFLMGVSMLLYSLAAVTHAWFTLPPHSFYGIWYVVFCDVLRCQVIPAFFQEEPGWYHLVQLMSLVSWLGLGAAFYMMLSLFNMQRNIKVQSKVPPDLMPRYHNSLISNICYVSALAIFLSLVFFYRQLCESSNDRPSISWSAALAVLSGIGEFTVGLLLMKSS